MRTRVWTTAAILFWTSLGLLLGSSGLLAQTTARQGAAAAQGDPTAFRSPMIVETPFLAADRGLWKYGWFAVSSDSLLWSYRCENVSISRLEMKAKDVAGGKVLVKFRPTLNNSPGHDKFVKLAFKVMNGDKESAKTEFGPVSVEEHTQVTRTIELLLPSEELRMNPVTRLQITMAVWDDD